MWARQRFSATHVTSMTKVRPAIILSKQCCTTFGWSGTISRSTRDFTYRQKRNKTKRSTKAIVDCVVAMIRSESREKKMSAVARSTGNSLHVNRFSTRLRASRAAACKHAFALRATACIARSRDSGADLSRRRAKREGGLRTCAHGLDSVGTAHYSEVHSCTRKDACGWPR